MTLSGDGAHSIVAKDTDAAGNTGTSNAVVFTLETVAPAVAISTASETSNVATPGDHRDGDGRRTRRSAAR